MQASNRFVLALGTLLLVSACGSNLEDTVSQTGLTPESEFAINDLAEKLSITKSEIEVLEASSVTWRSGALGCPEPGMSYMQMLTEGVLIRLKAGKQDYRYHGETGKNPFHCPDERATAPVQKSDAT